MNDRLDRDLLVGLIALRAGDIGPADLLDLLRDWSRDGRPPLSEAMVARGAIDAARCESIERLAADPARAWPSIRYTIESHFRDGGVGRVSVATDNEVHRRVAYKEMKEPYASEPRRRDRFLLEAEVTGRLEHPGIVPVYGLGTDAQGRPFYAMRLIEGVELQHAIEAYHEGRSKLAPPGDRALALRDLLNRMIAACQAISYAHSRGVIHRDIKPRNILLGRFGETVLIDWGLAKPLGDPAVDDGQGEGPLVPESGSGSEMTLPGDRHGTLGFIAPEHARDGVVGAAGDVYALGATLYAILTGRAPLGSMSWPLFLERLMAADYPRPRQVDPEVPPSLESVCLKALATDPSDRYDTPGELADDLTRWLADLPVSSHADPFPARAGRWARRHRPVVAGAAMALIASVAILTWSLAVIAGQKAEAESNFRFSLAAIRDTLSGFSSLQTVRKDDHNVWSEIPGMDAVRLKLTSAGIAILRELHARRPDDPRVRDQLAQMAKDLSHIQRLGGDPGGSLATSAMAQEINRSLRVQFPLDFPPAERECALHLDRSRAAEQAGDLGLAGAEARAAIEMGDVAGLDGLPRFHGNLRLAEVLLAGGDLVGARSLAGRAVDDLPRVRAHMSGGDLYLAATLLARSTEARIARHQGDDRGAIQTLEAALEEIPAKFDVNIAYFKCCIQRELADALLTSRGDLARAGRLADDANQRFVKIVRDFPSMIAYKLGLAETSLVRALIRFERDPERPEDAEADAVEAIRVLGGLAEASSNREDILLVHAGACRLLARIAGSRKKPEDAIPLLRAALNEYGEARKLSPNDPILRRGLEEALGELRVLEKAGQGLAP